MSDKQTKRVLFQMEKETKNTVKYQEIGDVPVIGTIYVPKHTLQTLGNSKAPQIVITIELP